MFFPYGTVSHELRPSIGFCDTWLLCEVRPCALAIILYNHAVGQPDKIAIHHKGCLYNVYIYYVCYVMLCYGMVWYVCIYLYRYTTHLL